MKRWRYDHLMTSHKAQLTEEELDDGWHMCSDWDNEVIHESWPEFALGVQEAANCSCGCPRKGVNSNLGRLIP